MSKVCTLLIADDSQEDREVYREYLSGDPNQSYQFIEAGSAEAGLALCQKQHYDAILLDFCLPDMTGLEFLDELKHLSATSRPVIMLTGQGDERIAVQAMKRGAQDYLIKQDLEPDILQLTVRNVIHQFRLQHHFHQHQGQRLLSAEVALHLHRSLDLEEILYTAVTQVQQILECDRVVLYQVISSCEDGLNCEPVAPTLTKRCETGLSGHIRDPIQRFVSFLTKVYSSCSQARQPTVVQEIGETTSCEPDNNQLGTFLLAPIQIQSLIFQPPASRKITGEPPTTSTLPMWGVLVACQDKNARQWQSDEITFLSDFAQQLAIALQQSEQLSQALAALEAEKQLSALKSQLVATVSHKYRSPLAAILAAASTMKMHNDKLPEIKQQQFLHLIEAKARQMTQLVDDLLVLETFESGGMNFTPMPFELLQLISDVIDEQRQIVGDRHELIFKITGNTKGFLGDQKLLRLILVNLLSNGIKYSPEGGVIEVHLTGSHTHITIMVKDEGIGIPMEDQAQVLQSSRRGSNVGTIPGTGLGLAIVKACVDLHGGEVTLKSQEDQGTEFTVCLPKQPTVDRSFN
jgi:signal transduction histidine kinase/DNA-binding response OmpR family regulator